MHLVPCFLSLCLFWTFQDPASDPLKVLELKGTPTGLETTLEGSTTEPAGTILQGECVPQRWSLQPDGITFVAIPSEADRITASAKVEGGRFRFQIQAPKLGTYESRFQVRFRPDRGTRTGSFTLTHPGTLQKIITTEAPSGVRLLKALSSLLESLTPLEKPGAVASPELRQTIEEARNQVTEWERSGHASAAPGRARWILEQILLSKPFRPDPAPAPPVPSGGGDESAIYGEAAPSPALDLPSLRASIRALHTIHLREMLLYWIEPLRIADLRRNKEFTQSLGKLLETLKESESPSVLAACIPCQDGSLKTLLAKMDRDPDGSAADVEQMILRLLQGK